MFEKNDRVKLSDVYLAKVYTNRTKKQPYDRATVYGYSRKGTVVVVWDGVKTPCTYHPLYLTKVWE